MKLEFTFFKSGLSFAKLISRVNFLMRGKGKKDVLRPTPSPVFPPAKTKPLTISLSVVIGARLGLGLLSFFSYILFPQAKGQPLGNPGRNTSDLSVLYNRLITIWGNWDGGWYLQIVKQGYQADPDSQAFFPLYPLLTKILGKLLFDQYLLAGVIVSTIMMVIFLTVFHEMVKRDFDEHLANRSTLYLLIFPTAFYFLAAYTESLFLALVLSSIYAARFKRNWWMAGILGALAALTRNMGVFVAVPLFIEWVSHRHNMVKSETSPDAKSASHGYFKRFLDSTILATILPVITLGGWIIYSQLFLRSGLGAFTSQSSWGREIALPWVTVFESLRVIFTPQTNGFPAIKIDWYQGSELLNLSFFGFGILMLGYGFWKFTRKQMPLSYLAFFGIGLLLPLVAINYDSPLISYPRYLLPLFPIFILWAQICQNRKWLHFFTLYISMTLLGLLFTLFANGFWVA